MKDLTFLYDQNEITYAERNRFFDSLAILSSSHKSSLIQKEISAQYEYLKEYGDILKLIRLRESMKPDSNRNLDKKLVRLVQLKP